MGRVSFVVVFGCVIFALAGSWMYFRHYQLSRPPLGVINLWDIAVMILAIIALPFLYLALPVWVVATLLLLTALSVLYFTVQPLVRARWAIWTAAVFFLLTDCAAVYLLGDQQNSFFAINNLTLIIVVVGIANLWAQSGVKARDMVVLGVALAVYDFVATAQSPLMSILIDRLSSLPLAPIIAWNSEGATLSLGLGDLLLAAVFPLVMRKAYGLTAGWAALTITLGTIGVVLAFPSRQGFPVMVVLGPLMALQYLYWSRRRGQERTTRQYLREDPVRRYGDQLSTTS